MLHHVMAIRIRFNSLHWYLSVKGALPRLFARPISTTDKFGAENWSWTLLVCSLMTVASVRLVNSRRVFCSQGDFCLSVCWCACATSAFESKRRVALPAGNRDCVCFDSDKIRPRWEPKTGSSLDPGTRSSTKVAEPASCGNSFDSGWKSGSFSKIEIDEDFNRSPILLCWRPICTSAGDWALCPLAVLKETKISDSSVLSLLGTNRLLARSRSLMVRMQLSIFPFSLWSPTGLSICPINW